MWVKSLRSVAAVIVGIFVAFLVIRVAETINFVIYGPAPDKSFSERGEEMERLMKNPAEMKVWLDSMPTGAMAVLQVAWSLGALLGGAVAALVAGRARLVHSGFVGGFVLFGTIYNFIKMKSLCNYDHPDWLIVTGLLLPLPFSVAGGKLIDMLLPVSATPAAPVAESPP